MLGALFALAGVLRYRNWWSAAIDLGVFDQGIWLLSRGLAPEVTINGRNLFADHLSPIVVLFVPLYRLWATPYWLFAAQGVALGATVGPLCALARHEGLPRWTGTAAVALGSPLAAAAAFDFHPSTLAVPFVAWAVLEVRRGNLTRASVAGLLIMSCRAELGWVLIGLAIVAAPHLRRRLLVLGSLGVILGVAVPAALGAHGTFTVHYGQLGATPLDALTHPWRVLATLASAGTLTKLAILFVPVFGLTFWKWRWAVAALVASLPILLSQWSGTRRPGLHYWAPTYPIAVGGALIALAAMERHRRVGCGLLVVGGLVAMATMSPLSPLAPPSVGWRSFTDHRYAREEAAASVRPGDSVVASERILSHLTHRREAWLFPNPYRPSQQAELGPPPSRAAARRVDVLVVEDVRAGRLAYFARAGFLGHAADRTEHRSREGITTIRWHRKRARR